jgi:hypothetical protein
MLWRYAYSVSARIFANRPYLRRKIARFGEIASWMYALSLIGEDFKVVKTREEIWKVVIGNSSKDFRLLEFGVAQGDGLRWWIENSSSNLIRVDGFDRFTGLPFDWRHLKAGSFNNDGVPPLQINDPRVSWHVGDVEETLPRFLNDDVSGLTHIQCIYLFDLDLGDPSMYVLNQLLPYLKAGDIVYFDESFDMNEEGLAFLHLTRTRKCKILAANFEGVAMELMN